METLTTNRALWTDSVKERASMCHAADMAMSCTVHATGREFLGFSVTVIYEKGEALFHIQNPETSGIPELVPCKGRKCTFPFTSVCELPAAVLEYIT